jgi:hypothetical protein
MSLDYGGCAFVNHDANVKGAHKDDEACKEVAKDKFDEVIVPQELSKQQHVVGS